MYEWDCWYCAVTLSGHSPGEANRAGRDHLMDNHRAEVAKRSLGRITGEPCQRMCGYTFPHDAEAIEEFVCPRCGKDNLKFFAGQDVWAGVDRR